MIPQTFCAAPWFAVRLDWDGQYKPCCEIDISKSEFNGRTKYSIHDSNLDQWMTSDYVKYIRESLHNGQKIKECFKCWDKESSGFHSPRQSNNDTVSLNQHDNLDNTWVKLFLKQQDYSKFHLMFADVKLSNVCNFACGMCNPHDSSKLFSQWKSNLDSEFVIKALDKNPHYFETISQNYDSQKGYKHLLDILDKPIKNLKLLGGEPLLDKQMFAILEAVEKTKQSKIHLHFVTNGSQNLVDAVTRLQNYRSVSFSVSLEGTNQIQDFIRVGSDWQLVEKNLLEAKQANINVKIHHTIQAMSILKIQDLLDWCNDNDFEISFGVLTNPDYLSYSVLPDKLKNLALKNIKDQSLISILEKQSSHPDKYPEFLRFVKWHNRTTTLTLQEILNLNLDDYVITKHES